jgi:AAA+ superfamily predicted ATPase
MVEIIETNTDSKIAPEIDILNANAHCLRSEVEWFARVVNRQLSSYRDRIGTKEEKEKGFFGKILGNNEVGNAVKFEPENGSISPPELAESKAIYAEFVSYYKMTTDERLILILTLLPHIQPQLLDAFFATNNELKRGFTEFGGIKGNAHGGFLPTIETALFITAGNDIDKRFRMAEKFESNHFLFSHNILYINQSQPNEPTNSGQLCMTEEFIDLFTTGRHRTPQFSMEFPAKRLITKMTWDDLVLDENTSRQLDDIRIWLKHGKTLLTDWGMEAKLKAGYKALFYGPPGTGKTLTASLLGKAYNLDVYRIDLSMVISKYIGDTEKNLEKVFKRAENKNWILFFDEADSLFGKRTNISDSHDKYANQEIAYLLQRLEDYPSLAILATNMRHNIDDAFTRRIQSIISFPMPPANERLKLWKSTFSQNVVFDQSVNLDQIARQYELAGGSILNVVQYASLMALNRNEKLVFMDDILNGIRKEYLKEGRTM